MKKYHIEVFGCQQNEYDASRLSNFLQSAGLVETVIKDAEVVFVLACSVRQMAVDRIYGRIRNWQEDGKKVYITACVTGEDKKKFVKKGAVYFKEFDELISFLKLSIKKPNLAANDSVYVPIMTGCNNFCSYCIVPYTRGREKSRPANEIIKEVSEIIANGKKEIVLLGQNVNSYRKSAARMTKPGKNQKSDFSNLLKKINKLPGDFQISFISNHPKDMGKDVIEAIATLPKVKKEIHLPLQSGSDKILKAMNRPYSAKEYLGLVKSLKSKVQKIKITTDIIVGFPRESEKDFQQTIEVCKKVGFSLAYVNKYSPRKGTAAYKLGDPIAWKEKQRRWKILNELINK